MADPSPPKEASKGPVADVAQAATKAAKKAVPEGNPALRMMGMPNFKLRLPSRNWMIFLSVTGSFLGAVAYDRHQKKKIQKKWCDSVAHLASQPLPTNQMQRRLTVYLSAPPADSAMSAREHFYEYVKPILVAAGLDWDAVEGRREGDVRAQLAERIRKDRKLRGEPSSEPVEEDTETVLLSARARMGVSEWPGPQGDIVIGRNTWKEYVRGLHEGWLGPLDAPPEPEPEPEPEAPKDEPTTSGTPAESLSTANESTADDASPTAVHSSPPAEDKNPSEEKKEEEPAKPQKRKQPPPYISLAEYSTAALSPNCPPELTPSTTIAFPHILGFLNTPIRMYRFLTQRYLADEIGAQVAAAVFGAYRPYASAGGSDVPTSPVAGVAEEGEEEHKDLWEQQRLLRPEEKEWHKSIRKQADARREKGEENLWVDGMTLDPRIASRMMKFELAPEENERAARIARGEEGVFGAEKEE